MKNVLWMVPVHPGKTDVARRYCLDLETTRRAAFERSEIQIGLDREMFFLWHGPDGDYIVLFMGGADVAASMRLWADADGEFETWGKKVWAEFSDPEDWPQPIWAGPNESKACPELICAWDNSQEREGL